MAQDPNRLLDLARVAGEDHAQEVRIYYIFPYILVAGVGILP